MAYTLTNLTFNIDMDKVLADYKAKNPNPPEGKVGGYTQSITVRLSPITISAQSLLACGLWTWREYIEFVYPQAMRAGDN